MNEPQSIIAGNTYAWSESESTFPASIWTLTYYLVGAVQTSFTGSANGNDFAVTMSSALTDTLPEGTYSLSGFMSKSVERYSYSTTTVTVTENPAKAVSGTDTRSHAKKALAMVETAIENYAQNPYQTLSINGKSKSWNLPELLKLRALYRRVVKDEERAEKLRKGMDAGGKILVRFR